MNVSNKPIPISQRAAEIPAQSAPASIRRLSATIRKLETFAVAALATLAALAGLVWDARLVIGWGNQPGCVGGSQFVREGAVGCQTI